MSETQSPHPKTNSDKEASTTPPSSDSRSNYPDYVHLHEFLYSGEDVPHIAGFLWKVIIRNKNVESGKKELSSHYVLNLYRETFSKAKEIGFNPNYNFKLRCNPYHHHTWSEDGILETRDTIKFYLGEGQIDDGKYREWFLPFK